MHVIGKTTSGEPRWASWTACELSPLRILVEDSVSFVEVISRGFVWDAFLGTSQSYIHADSNTRCLIQDDGFSLSDVESKPTYTKLTAGSRARSFPAYVLEGLNVVWSVQMLRSENTTVSDYFGIKYHAGCSRPSRILLKWDVCILRGSIRIFAIWKNILTRNFRICWCLLKWELDLNLVRCGSHVSSYCRLFNPEPFSFHEGSAPTIWFVYR